MDDDLRLAARATTNYVSQLSMALILRGPQGGVSIGSASCVKVGDHYLLATAAHNFSDLAADEQIELRAAGELSRERIEFVGRSCAPGRRPPRSDVAWIEVSEEASRANNLRFAELTDLHIVPHQTRDYPFLIQGYPGESVRGATDAGGNLDLESTVAMTMAAEAAELPTPPELFDFVVVYPPRDHNEFPIQDAPMPHGLSGGGVWRMPRHDETVVWAPDRLWLVGINRAWLRGRNLLYCTKIEEWLQLVATDFPDTQPLVAHFLERRPW